MYVHLYIFLVLFSSFFCFVLLEGFFLVFLYSVFFLVFLKAAEKRDMELEGWKGRVALRENEGTESQYCTKKSKKNNLNFLKCTSP